MTGIGVIYLVLIWSIGVFCCRKPLPVKFSWSSVEFKYDNADERDSEIANGSYNPQNVIILDSDIYKGVNYATTPALLPGSPVTVSKISDELDSNGSPLLKPFPNWAWQNRTNCEGLISAFRFKIDKLGRMWIIDSGTIDVFTANSKAICPPKIVAFDLENNNSLITKYEIPKSQLADDSLLLAIEVQIMDSSGKDTIVYIADTTGYRMMVYHLSTNQSYLIQHPYFKNDDAYDNFTVNGVNFTLSDGIFYLALDQKRDIMYFHSLSSGYQCYVDAELLRKTRPLTDVEKQQFVRFNYKRKNHTSADVITRNGILIFSTIENNAIYAWNSSKAFYPRYFKLIQQDDVNLQFVTGMKLIGDYLLATTSRLQYAIAYSENEKGTDNFRILQYSLKSLFKKQC